MRIRWRFSVRALLVAVTAAAIGFGWLGRAIPRKQAEREALAHFTGAFVGSGPLEGPELPWLGPLLGADFFQHLPSLQLWHVQPETMAKAADVPWVKTIHFMENHRLSKPFLQTKDFAALSGLRRVRQFQFEGPYDDRVLEHVQHLKFERVVLAHTRFDGSGLRWLDPQRLQILSLSDSPIHDSGLVRLARFPQLRGLLLEELPITGAGLYYLNSLDNLDMLCLVRLKLAQESLSLCHWPKLRLRTLMVMDIPLEDAAVAPLAACASLERLYLIDTRVTPEAARRLADALPRCRIRLERRHRAAEGLGPGPPDFHYDRVFLAQPAHQRCDEMLDLDREAFAE